MNNINLFQRISTGESLHRAKISTYNHNSISKELLLKSRFVKDNSGQYSLKSPSNSPSFPDTSRYNIFRYTNTNINKNLLVKFSQFYRSILTSSTNQQDSTTSRNHKSQSPLTGGNFSLPSNNRLFKLNSNRDIVKREEYDRVKHNEHMTIAKTEISKFIKDSAVLNYNNKNGSNSKLKKKNFKSKSSINIINNKAIEALQEVKKRKNMIYKIDLEQSVKKYKKEIEKNNWVLSYDFKRKNNAMEKNEEFINDKNENLNKIQAKIALSSI